MQLRIYVLIGLCCALIAIMGAAPPPGGLPAAAYTLSFEDKANFRQDYYEGTGEVKFADGKAAVTLHCKAAAIYPYKKLQRELASPLAATVFAELSRGKAEMRLVFVDQANQEFRVDWQGLVAGKNELNFALEQLLAKAQKPVRLTAVSLRSADGSATVVLDKIAISGDDPGALADIPAGFYRHQETLVFEDKVSFRQDYYEGTGEIKFADGKAAVTLHCKAAAIYPYAKLQPVLTQPLSATVFADLQQGKAEMRLVFVDQANQEFRADWQGLAPGKNGLNFVLEQLLAKAKKPVRLTAVSLRSADGSATVVLDKIEFWDIVPLVNALRFTVESEYPINIENPESDKKAGLLLVNPFAEPIRIKLKGELRDFDGKTAGIEHNITLPPNQSCRIDLPPATTRGIRYGKIDFCLPEVPDVTRQEEFTVAVMTPAVPSQKRPKGFLFGVCSHPQYYSAEDQKKEAAAAALCGAKVLREDAQWSKIQPQQERWDFSSLDQTVKIFGEQGLELELIYSYTPKWAIAKNFVPLRPERVHTHNSLPDDQAWGEFVRRTAGRYRGTIRFFEIWNEPDLFSFANFTAEEYIEMLKIASIETRKVNPDALILTGGFTCMPPFFALNDQQHQEKTLSQAKGMYDIHAFHGHGPFSHYYPQIERMLTMRNNLGVTAPWWANETAETSVFVGEAGQAVTLWKKLFYSWANGAVGYNWYDLRNDGTDPRNVENNFGMIRQNFNPKAVYPAYNTITRHFSDATYLQTLGKFPLLRFYQFGKDGQLLTVGWNDSPDSETRTFVCRTDAGEVQQFDLFDNLKTLPVTAGYLLLPINKTPSGLLLADAKQFEMLGEPVKIAGSILLPRGDNTVIIQLENPFATPETVELKLTLPEKATLKTPIDPIRLAGNEVKKIAVSIVCGQNPTADSQLKVDLRFTSRQLAGETTYPVRPVIKLEKKFGGTPDLVLDHSKQVNILVPADPGKVHLFWQGARDLSAAVSLASDEKTLKLKAVVTDDIHYQPYQNEQVWQGDNIQIGFQIPGQSKIWEIGLTRLADGSSQRWVWSAPDGFDKDKCADSIRLKTLRNDDAKETVYEADIPLSSLGAEHAEMIRFNLIVNDNDGEMRESFVAAAPGMGAGNNPDEWYLLSLKSDNN